MSTRDEKKADSSEEDDEEVKVVLTQNLLRVDEVFVYAVPPMKTSGGHRAEDWNLAKPAATCALNLVRRDNTLLIRLMSHRPREGGPKGATEEFLFAQCRIVVETDAARKGSTPGVEYWVESVVDSSRYFVVRCEDEKTNRQAFVGVGFRERSDATNFKMGMSDFMRAMDRERRAAELASSGGGGGCSGDDGKAAADMGASTAADDGGVPSVSKLSLKEGEKIHVNLGGQGRRREERKTRTNLSASHASVSAVGTGGLLLRRPPPPAGAAAASAAEGEKSPERPSGDDGRIGESPSGNDGEKSKEGKSPAEVQGTSENDDDGGDEEDWGDFESG